MEDESSYTVRTENGLIRLMSEEDVGKFVRSSMQRAKTSSAKAASFTKNRSRRAASPRSDLGPVIVIPEERTTNAPTSNGELDAKEKQQQDQSDLVREASRRIASRSRLIPRKEARTDTSSRDERVTEREKIPQSSDSPKGASVKIDDKQSSQLESFPRDDDRDQQSRDIMKSNIDTFNVKSTDKKRLPIWFSYLAENDTNKTSEDKRSFTVNTEAEGKKNLSESEINNLVRSSIQRARQLAKSKTRRHSPRTKESTNRRSKEKKDPSFRKIAAPSPLGTIHRKFTWSFELSDDDGEAIIIDRRINEAVTRKSERKKLDQARRRAAKSQTVSKVVESIETELAAPDKLESNLINPSINQVKNQTRKRAKDQTSEDVEYTQHDYEVEVKETDQVLEVGEISAADVQDILSGHEELLAVTEDSSAEHEQIGGVFQVNNPAITQTTIVDKREENEGQCDSVADESVLLVPVQPNTETFSIMKENENVVEQVQRESDQNHTNKSNASTLALTDAISSSAQEIAGHQEDLKDKQPSTVSEEVFENSLTFSERLEPLDITTKDEVTPEPISINASEIRASDNDGFRKNETIAALPSESSSQKARSFLLGASNSDLKESLTQGGEISLPSLSVNFTSADECIASQGCDRNPSHKELEVDTSFNEPGKDIMYDDVQNNSQNPMTALTTILENSKNSENIGSEISDCQQRDIQPSEQVHKTTLLTETDASEETREASPLEYEQDSSKDFPPEAKDLLAEKLRQNEINGDKNNLGSLPQTNLIPQNELNTKDQQTQEEKPASATSLMDDVSPPISSKDVIENQTIGMSIACKRSVNADSSRPPLPTKVVDSYVGVVSHRPNGSPVSFREEPFLQMKESASSSDEYPVTRTLKYKFSNSTKSDLITSDSGRRSRRSRRSKKTTRKQKESSDVEEVLITDELIAEIAAKKGAKVTTEELNEMVKSLSPPKPVDSIKDSKVESMTHVGESSEPLESKLSHDTATHVPVENERQSKTSPTKNPGFAPPYIRSRFCMDFLDLFQQLVNDPDDETIEDDTLNSNVVTWVESSEENGTRQRKKKYESDGGFEEIQERSRVTFSFSDAEQQTTDDYTDGYSTADETRDNKIEWPSWRA